MFRHLHKDFPILLHTQNGKPYVYFDNASTTHKPQAVLDALMAFYTTSNANVHRGIYTLANSATEQYERARATVAAFIGAHASEIVFTSGATHGINLVAHAWAMEHMRAGDVILISQLEHHANILPWQEVAQKTGALLHYIPVLSDGTVDENSLDVLINDRVKLVAITHLSNVLGTHVPVEMIIKKARAVGATIFIDAAQSAPHGLVNIAQLQPDFLVFSGHKMLGPTGIGVLYINKKMHKQMEPYQRGGGMVFAVDQQSATWAQAPHMFEAGTPPIAQAIGLGAAIEYMQRTIDFAQLHTHHAQLCTRLIEGLVTLPGIRILGPVPFLKQYGHMVSFVVEGIHAHDVAAYLCAQGIFVRAGHHCAQPLANQLQYDASVRVSFYFYNTLEQVDLLLTALGALVLFKK